MAGKTQAGFTLIEIVITLVIMAILVGTATLSVVSGLKNAHRREAVRATMGFIRHARAVALVRQRAVALTFEESEDGTGTFAKSRVSMAFSGEGKDDDVLAVDPKEFPGIHVRTGPKEKEVRKNISFFSNADALRKRAAETAAKRAAADSEKGTEGGSTAKADGAKDEGSETEDAAGEATTALIEANGQCEPYVVRIWKEGETEDDAVVIEVSKFCKPVVKEDRR